LPTRRVFFAVTYSNQKVGPEMMSRFPKLQLVATFGVGYDHIDANSAAAHGIVVTHTRDVLNEEVADTALGLLLCTVREFPRPNVTCAPVSGNSSTIRSPRRRFATARSDCWAWDGSAAPSRAGSTRSGARRQLRVTTPDGPPKCHREIQTELPPAIAERGFVAGLAVWSR
jgi:hypothetical protein